MGIKSCSHMGQFRMVRKHCLRTSCTGLVLVFSPGEAVQLLPEDMLQCQLWIQSYTHWCNCPAAPSKQNLWSSGPLALKGNKWFQIAIAVYLRSVAHTHCPLCVCVFLQCYMNLDISSSTFPPHQFVGNSLLQYNTYLITALLHVIVIKEQAIHLQYVVCVYISPCRTSQHTVLLSSWINWV